MPSKQDLERRLASVRNTKKITYAMKLVSAAKLKKAQDASAASKRYMDSLLQVLGKLIAELEGSDVTHPLLEERQVQKIGLIVVGGSRGLAGAYNSNVGKRVDAFFNELSKTRPGVSVETFILGKKVAEHYRRVKRKYVRSEETLPEDPFRWPITELCNEVCEKFVNHELDEVYLIYTKFRSAISMSVQSEKLLPLSLDSVKVSEEKAAQTLFEPSVTEVMTAVLPLIVRSLVQRAALDAKAGEHGSRMTAMDSASKNAGDLINSLKLTVDKLRQGKITAELLDIIGGSEAT